MYLIWYIYEKVIQSYRKGPIFKKYPYEHKLIKHENRLLKEYLSCIIYQQTYIYFENFRAV